VTTAFIALEQLSQDASRPSQKKIHEADFLPPHVAACAQQRSTAIASGNDHAP